jgi:isocitrate dehydrogenase kinase/phosphatase
MFTKLLKNIKKLLQNSGQVKHRFTTGQRAYVVKFHPDEAHGHSFMAGMANKKIVQWDTRTQEIEQVSRVSRGNLAKKNHNLQIVRSSENLN